VQAFLAPKVPGARWTQLIQNICRDFANHQTQCECAAESKQFTKCGNLPPGG